MKSRIILLLLVGALAGVAGYSVAHRLRCRPPQSDLDRLRDVFHLAHALELRPEQIESMMTLQGRLCETLAESCDRHCACRKELAAALVAEPFDAAHAQELWESLCRCYAESEMLAMEHIRNLRELLDAPQRVRFDRMITEALAGPCRACTTCGAVCGEPRGGQKR